MYRPRAFVVDDVPSLHTVIRDCAFATIAVVDDGAIRFAYAPVVLDEESGSIRFHLARANPVAELADGASLAVSFTGPDAYISPDWYESEGLVPTWNYIAVEGTGVARRLDDRALNRLLVDLSASEEAKLLPKAPWTLDKVEPRKLAALQQAIIGFELGFETLQGKFKLSQDKKLSDIDGVIRGLEVRGDARSLAVANAMRAARPG